MPVKLIIKCQLTLSVFFLSLAPVHAELYFPAEMISADSVADLSQFSADGTQIPGVYGVDIYLNDTFVTHQDVKFDRVSSEKKDVNLNDDTGLVPCLNRRSLDRFGVKVELFPELMNVDATKCIHPAEYIPGVSSQFDFQRMRLNLNTPQLITRNTARGDVSPELWDDGINAFLMNYRFTGNDRSGSTDNSKSYFLTLNSGFNLGPWRLRDDRSWNYYDSHYGRQQTWQRMRTYVERAVIPFKSQLVLGESTTDSRVFDSLGFRGIQLSSADDMLPYSLQGYAPIVRGIAEGNSEISVRQNGYTIYRTNVSAGPFEITDLKTMYSSGDLEVSVKDASGKVRLFTIPYSSLPSLQREGQVKYSLAAGKYRGGSDRYDAPAFAQGTLMWGLPHNVSYYGGVQYSPEYLAVQSGAGIDLGTLGAFSADITHANSTLSDGSHYKGQSVRFLYAHAFNLTGTTFRLAGYRYSTKGYHTLDETALKTTSGRLYDHSGLDSQGLPVSDTWSDVYNLKNSKRARFESSISQKLGDFGSLWLTGMQQTYWNSASRNTSLSLGYSNTLGPVTYSFNYGYSLYKNQNAPSYKDHSVSLSLSVPLDKLLPGAYAKPLYINENLSHDSSGNLLQQTGLSGQLLDGNNLSWNVSQGYDKRRGMSGNAGLDYRGTYGNTTLGYSHSRDWQQVNYGLSGGLLIHRNGLTLGQPLSDTSVLIAAPGVSGVRLKNEPGVQTDWRGYTIKPYASPYRENSIQVDSEQLDEYTDVDISTARVIPTKGAIVRADFKAHRGYRLLMTVLHNNSPLPFGTLITSADASGIVADDGLVYLSGMQERGTITARWGSGAEQECHGAYQLDKNSQTAVMPKLSVQCR